MTKKYVCNMTKVSCDVCCYMCYVYLMLSMYLKYNRHMGCVFVITRITYNLLDTKIENGYIIPSLNSLSNVSYPSKNMCVCDNVKLLNPTKYWAFYFI